MNRTRRLLAVTAVGAFLFAGATACGSSGSDSSSGDDSAKTTVADSSGDKSTDDTKADDSSSDDGGGKDCADTKDSDNLSGDSVVLFAADQDELNEADLTDEHIAKLAADGSSLDPSTIEIGAGEMFGIQADTAGGIEAAIIGCATGQTLVPGVAVGFVITEPGTYPISLDIAGTDLGEVVVS